MLFSYYTVGEIRNLAFSYKTIKRRMKRKIFIIKRLFRFGTAFSFIHHDRNAASASIDSVASSIGGLCNPALTFK
ncbi:hypothetical protein CN931_24900 [Bacillus sp. AFS054943]|uniref:Uncharacterized protein n=1 Tax=Bacillus cereus TaxID=1396 RepID=A0A2A8J545_BACCE|nr:hypothetical protein CN476_07090 [Bacillus cereus]PFA61542.1 hypothetical protein CN402_11020 [Bacillus sp. AFS015896]PGL77405.1 hypothetical protein CN931_24900 [Bacillus sp. AFS054943]PGX14638.1 hypothetical protein COE07_03990 [Bacillus sp. AFS033286]PGZ73099.1 hypothetical protein COE49_15080 [Bacillus sp. AFS029637]